MTAGENNQPLEPARVRAFAHFFKRYMSISSVVTASLPIPVTALHVIPTFAVQTKVLSTYTPLFCFLILGFIFYNRHQLARLMFPEYFVRPRITDVRILNLMLTIRRNFIVFFPLVLIVLSLFCVFRYHEILNDAISNIRSSLIEEVKKGETDEKDTSLQIIVNKIKDKKNIKEKLSDKWILSETDRGVLYNYNSSILMVYYMAIFITAEASFILMAIKEYLQDLVGLTEMDLIHGPLKSEKSG